MVRHYLKQHTPSDIRIVEILGVGRYFLQVLEEGHPNGKRDVHVEVGDELELGDGVYRLKSERGSLTLSRS